MTRLLGGNPSSSNSPWGECSARPDKAASASARCCSGPRFASTSMAFSRGCCTLCWASRCWDKTPRSWSSPVWRSCGYSIPGSSSCRRYCCRCGRYCGRGVFLKSVFVRRTCTIGRINFAIRCVAVLSCRRHNKVPAHKETSSSARKKSDDAILWAKRSTRIESILSPSSLSISYLNSRIMHNNDRINVINTRESAADSEKERKSE